MPLARSIRNTWDCKRTGHGKRTLSRKSTAKPLSRKSGKKEAKPRKKRGRKPVDQSFCETCGADLEHYAKSTASKMRSWCKNGQSRCNKQTRKHRTRKQIAEPLTKPCRIELERIEDIRNKSRKSGKKEAKPKKNRGRKPVDHSYLSGKMSIFLLLWKKWGDSLRFPVMNRQVISQYIFMNAKNYDFISYFRSLGFISKMWSLWASWNSYWSCRKNGQGGWCQCRNAAFVESSFPIRKTWWNIVAFIGKKSVIRARPIQPGSTGKTEKRDLHRRCSILPLEGSNEWPLTGTAGDRKWRACRIRTRNRCKILFRSQELHRLPEHHPLNGVRHAS